MELAFYAVIGAALACLLYVVIVYFYALFHYDVEYTPAEHDARITQVLLGPKMVYVTQFMIACFIGTCTWAGIEVGKWLSTVIHLG